MRKLKDLFDNKSDSACYFIADIAANHDGSLSKAKDLIHAAAESGANAAKFQNFKAKQLLLFPFAPSLSVFIFTSLQNALFH